MHWFSFLKNPKYLENYIVGEKPVALRLNLINMIRSTIDPLSIFLFGLIINRIFGVLDQSSINFPRILLLAHTSTLILCASGTILLLQSMKKLGIYFEEQATHNASQRIRYFIRRDLLLRNFIRDRTQVSGKDHRALFLSTFQNLRDFNFGYAWPSKPVFFHILSLALSGTSLFIVFGWLGASVFITGALLSFMRARDNLRKNQAVNRYKREFLPLKHELRQAINGTDFFRQVSPEINLSGLAHTFLRLELNSARGQLTGMIFTPFLKNCVRFAFLILLLSFLSEGLLPAGDVIVFWLLGELTMQGFESLCDFNSEVQNHTPILESASELFARIESIPLDPFYSHSGPTIDKGPIRFSQATKRLGPNGIDLSDFNEDLPIHKCIALVGMNQMEASEFASLIAGRSQLESGTLTYNEFIPAKLPRHEWDRKIREIPYNPIIFTGTIRENLNAFRASPASDEELWLALEQVGLEKEIRKNADGLSTILSAETKNFSQNELRQIYLARCFLDSSSHIFFFHSPLFGFDSAIKQRIVKSFELLANKTNYVFFTAQPSDVTDSYAICFEPREPTIFSPA